jgi:hypothetical protein
MAKFEVSCVASQNWMPGAPPFAARGGEFQFDFFLNQEGFFSRKAGSERRPKAFSANCAVPTQYVTDQPTTIIVRTSNSSPTLTTLSAFP